MFYNYESCSQLAQYMPHSCALGTCCATASLYSPYYHFDVICWMLPEHAVLVNRNVITVTIITGITVVLNLLRSCILCNAKLLRHLFSSITVLLPNSTLVQVFVQTWFIYLEVQSSKNTIMPSLMICSW